ncbi:MAG: hypothetical protein COX41_01680 [Candidatus Omnitrophica bacterium CG23_combo_of_CG06-09_8_20_14_all_41_10]|uniref:Thioredoxin-like fold domain-containing protein n=1 Tax=Candidatus Sherwoodlollariibacterium unditelluris TaxID=1974757 RepID=A0A2G9YKA4_9BACT|nr:MAG: hypothetical protein COX41_01680 [Candidatus Omnitrophica bacterium CG23_combo_of_CG06-09_8_20_14_all_41_10]
MLHILAVVIIVFLFLNPASLKAGFFEEKDTSVQESGCGECSKETVNLNSDLKAKVGAIERAISNNFNKKEDTYGNEIVLFIDLTNNSSDVAVNALVKFKKDNPTWKIRGVILGSQKNLKEKLLEKQKFFSNGIEFSIDLSGRLAKEFGIFKTPAYVIIYKGKHHKFTGFIDLNDEISKLDK